MVKHTDLERKKETLITKLTTAQNKLDRAKREHQLLVERLEEKIETFKKEIDNIENNTIEKTRVTMIIYYQNKKESMNFIITIMSVVFVKIVMKNFIQVPTNLTINARCQLKS